MGVPPTRGEPPFFSHHTRQAFAGAMGFPALQPNASRNSGWFASRARVSGSGTGEEGQAAAAAWERSQARTSPAFRPSGRLRHTSQYA